MTFQARIEELIGTVDDTTALDQYCRDEAEHLLRTLPAEQLLSDASRIKTTTSAGVVVTGKRVLAVRRGKYRCRMVDGADPGRYDDTTHLTAATQRKPVYWVEVAALDTRLYVAPAPASGDGELYVWHVAYPTVDADADQTLSHVPTAVEELIVVGAARRVLQRRLSDAEADDDVEIAGAIIAQIQNLNNLYDRRLAMLGGVAA